MPQRHTIPNVAKDTEHLSLRYLLLGAYTGRSTTVFASALVIRAPNGMPWMPYKGTINTLRNTHMMGHYPDAESTVHPLQLYLTPGKTRQH
jgi:hypothetical protein